MGLIKTAAKVAVASSVHGRVQRRQQTRWAAQDAPAPAAAPTADPHARQLAHLAKLGELRASGVLTEAEFQAQKAAILR
jgi:hypothetical protein